MNKILRNEFGLNVVEIKKLNGYDNANYLVKTNTSKYIFKTYSADSELHDLVVAENETLLFLQKFDKNKYPKPIQFIDGSFVKNLNIDGEKPICRMLSFIEGELFGDTKHSKELFQSFGLFLAEMDLNL